MKNKESLKSIASQIIYDELYYMYCDNCRFRSEIGDEDARKRFRCWPCEDCHRRCNGWGVSKEVADRIAENIIEKIGSEKHETNNQN